MYQPFPRIQQLRAHMLVRPAVCVERAKYFTQSFRATEGEPACLRRAEAFSHLVAHMSVTIFPHELVVGHPTSKIRGGSISPELQCDWILDELELLSTRTTDPFLPLSQEEKDTLRAVVPYWRTRCLRALWNEQISPRSKQFDDLLLAGGAYCGNNQYPGHSAPDYAFLLKNGTEGILAMIQARLAQGGTPEQTNELTAMSITLEALNALAQRYSEHAACLAALESDPVRKGELEHIAAICRAVPRRPAADLYEAVQALWFGYLCIMLENWGTGNTFLRIDQYLEPYYRKHLEAGGSKEDALELIASLLILCNSACVVYSEARSHGFAGNNSGCSFTIGGIKPDGTCAVNDLSYLVLEAERMVNMGSDDVVVRLSEHSPDAFIRLACEVARDVGGKLKFLGDQTTISNLILDGMTPNQASDYAIAGCTSPAVAGVSYHIPGGILSLPGVLELTLNNGIHPLTGLRLGPPTGFLHDHPDFNSLWQAFCTQLDEIIPHCHAIKNLDKALFHAYLPSPFQSALYPCCIARGTDVIAGGTKPFYSFALSVAGAPNTGDALAAIKKLVYEEKRITARQLEQALAGNFDGHEALLQLLRRAPKFGNNDPYVDTLVGRVIAQASTTISSYEGYLGAASTVAAAAVTANIGLGLCLGATADGRRRGEPVSEGGISPAQGRNTSGATSTMLSVAKLDHTYLRHGEVLNLRLHPDAVASREKLNSFCALIKTYLQAGGALVQFNIVSTQTLRDAQRHPEKYRDLVVRVATYAAYFVELGPALQNDIIDRLEFSSC